MKINSLTLQNIRSYEDQTVEFPEGTILIHGENGAGKTSLLMGIFGGLFLSKIRNVGTNDFRLDDLVRRGEDKGTVELVFEIDGTEYTATWKLYTTSTPNSATLDAPSFSEPITGIGPVREEVISLLGMAEDDFSSSVYVKQGEIDRLIDAGNRAEMIDSLLGLDEIDEYIDRMKLARRGAGRVQERNKNSRENYQEDLNGFEYTEPEYEDEIQSLTDRIQELEAEVEEYDEFIDQLKEQRNRIEGDIGDYEDLEARREDKVEQIESAQEDRTDAQSDIDDSESTIEDAQDDIETLEDEIAALNDEVQYDLTTADSARDAREEAQSEYTTASTERTERKNDFENAQAELERLEERLTEARDEREARVNERDDLEARLEETETDLEGAESNLNTRLNDRNERVAAFLSAVDDPDEVTDEHERAVTDRIEDLREQREDLTGTKREVTTTREHTSEDLEDARSERDDAEDELADAEAELADIEDDIERAEDDLSEAEDEFERRLDALASLGSDLDIDVTSENLGELRDTVLPNRLEQVNAELNDVGNTIAGHENDIERYEEEIAELTALEKDGTCPKCGQPVDETHVADEVADLEAQIDDAESALEDEREAEAALQSEKASLQDLRDDVIDAIQFRENTRVEAREDVTSLRDEAADVEAHIDEVEETIEAREATITELEAEIDKFDERVADLDDEIETVTTDIETGDEVLDTFEAVRDQRDAVDTLETEIEDLQSDIEDVADTIDTLDEEIADLKGDIADQDGAVEDAEAALEAADGRVEELDDARKTVEDAVERYDEIADLRTTIQQEQQSIQHARDRIEDLNSQIARLREEKEDIEDDLGEKDIEDLRDDLEQVEELVEKRQDQRDDRQEELQDTRDERTRLEADLENFRSKKAQIDLLERKERWAQEVHDELDSTIAIYESTKSDLREQYLAYINEYTNDIFKEIYKNSSYQQVLIEEAYNDRSRSYEYDIRLLRDDGTTEDPSNASGGERAIVNLALRAGIYKLIAELHGGNQGQLPPFILDEPTTFLDEGHVGQLEQMLTTIQEWNVPQIIVVSHDESLIHGADHECYVTIDEASKTSQITMRTAGDD